MQFPIETIHIVGAVSGLAVLLVAAAIWVAASWRRLDQGWRLVESNWRTVRARLKDRADLLPQLVEVTQHRLRVHKEALEVLMRLRTRSIAGRNPPEKAAAEAELEALLDRVLATAAADPGLAGVSEFETVRIALRDNAIQIRHAANVYNDAVAAYNRLAMRFPASLLSRRAGSERAERFDDGRGSFSAPLAEGQGAPEPAAGRGR
jgi:hypothetical protein